MEATINLKVPSELKNRIQELAEIENTSINRMLGSVISNFVFAKDKELEAEQELALLLENRLECVKNGSDELLPLSSCIGITQRLKTR